MTKTYIARGLLEYRMTIETGGAKLRICFSGGAMGSNGILPAKYITDNGALQHLIENSPQYKSGRVCLLKSEKDPLKNVGKY